MAKIVEEIEKNGDVLTLKRVPSKNIEIIAGVIGDECLSFYERIEKNQIYFSQDGNRLILNTRQLPKAKYLVAYEYETNDWLEEEESEGEDVQSQLKDWYKNYSGGELDFFEVSRLILKKFEIERHKAIMNDIPVEEKRVKVFIEKIKDDVTLPRYSNPYDAGMDIGAYVQEGIDLCGGETKIIPTGLKFAIPKGYELQVRPRSGLSLQGFVVANSPGTIDSGYRDEVGIIIHIRNGYGPFHISNGDRIAQIVLNKIPTIELKEVGEVASIGLNRGGGFGHTGIK